MNIFARVALAFSGLLALAAANAQSYPSKPVRILAAFGAGGPGDMASRGAAQVLTQVLGQPFTVENRLGADGIIAGEACAKAASDGYTFCVFDNYALALNPVIRVKMPYDTARDLTPVVHLGFAPAGIFAHPSVAANSLQALFDLAKAKPDSITWGSFGLASSSNLYIEWLKKAKGISFLNIPYKGASQAWQALLAGEVQVVAYTVATVVGQIKAGKAKALAVATSERSPYMPEVPTYAESGMEIAIVTWFGMMAPSGVPSEIVQRVNAEVTKGLLNNVQLRDKFLTPSGILILSPSGGPPNAFAEFLRAQHAMYSELMRVTGLKIE
jgi:tripartite-type tricarboxylate transporter receptor subunit TctC